MTGRIALSALGKAYRQYRAPSDRLLEWLSFGTRKRHDLRWALREISLEVQAGEAVGIIGANGAGKSTLLKLVTGTTQPTTGMVHVQGRVAALLELGIGFHPDATGRDNALMAGQLLGYRAAEIAARMSDIEQFAEIGDYMDLPLRTYSSGMQVRLAFSVATAIRPDILIVDEALAVGDAAFQAKAMTRIQQILSRGTTLLFVGHDLNAVRAFCQRAILLEGGCMAMLGGPEEVIEEYLFRVHAKAAREGQAKPVRIAEGFRSEDGGVLGLSLQGGARHLALNYGDVLEIDVDLELQGSLADAACIIDILDDRGVPLSGRRIRLPGPDAGRPADGLQRLRLRIAFRAELARGIYRVRARLVQAPDRNQHHRRVLCRYESDLSFEVIDNSIERFCGLFPLPAEVVVQPLPADDDGA